MGDALPRLALVLLVVGLLPLARPIRAATPALPVHVVPTELAPDAFDDPAWSTAVPIEKSTQQEPEEGAPATLGIDCRAIATPRALLLRFRLAQPRAAIVAHELRRDSTLTSDDQIVFVLDTWHDRRNAYYFATNPNGVRVDGLISEQRAPSLDWDTVWDVRVRRTPAGWEALFRIPFASLAFAGVENGTWGFNFAREARRIHERSRWTGWTRPWKLHQVSHAGDLTGIPPMPSRRLRQVTPYVAGAYDHRESPADDSFLGKPGLDLRYGVTSSIEADLTINTDFAETEVDAQQFNFGRTSLFFPEKRSFFLQRSQVFEFGDKDTAIPFFSRRIGLSDQGSEIPIDAGLKTTGRAGRTEFGALAVQTRTADGVPRSDFFVGRVKQDVGHSTYVGALVTDVERAGDTGLLPGRSLTWGIDLESNPFPELRVNSYYTRTETPGVAGRNAAWSIDGFYTGKNIRGELQRASFGSAYEPAVGFVAASGVAFWFLSLGGIARPRVLGVQDVSFDVFYFPRDNEDGSANERLANAKFTVNWLNGAYFDASFTNFDERLGDPLDLNEHATIPSGRYRFDRQTIAIGSNPTRSVAVQVSASQGGYYGGQRRGYHARLDVKPSSHFGVSLIEDYNVVRLPGGDFDLSLVSARVDWNASVRLLTSVVVQSNNLDELTNVQAIVRWLIDPATNLFVVFNRQSGAGFERPGTRLTAKFQKTFEF
ncbi:MAG: DUF5916 domain-containing protein [Thermoanaerobaculia bacterium]